jgi:hypothetical protein
MAPSPTPTTTAGRAQQLPSQQVPMLDTGGGAQPASVPSEPHDIYYLEEGVQKDADYQVKWTNWMSDGQKQSFYKHVFVLLLSWHPECDDMAVDLEVTQEFILNCSALPILRTLIKLTLQRSNDSRTYLRTFTITTSKVFKLIAGYLLALRLKPT